MQDTVPIDRGRQQRALWMSTAAFTACFAVWTIFSIIGIEVQQKERGWGEGYGPEQRNGEWEYARFDAQTGARRDTPLNACFTCHLQARGQQDFTFTAWDYANRAR